MLTHICKEHVTLKMHRDKCSNYPPKQHHHHNNKYITIWSRLNAILKEITIKLGEIQDRGWSNPTLTQRCSPSCERLRLHGEVDSWASAGWHLLVTGFTAVAEERHSRSQLRNKTGVNWGMTQEVNEKTVWILNWGMTQEVNGKTVWIVNWGMTQEVNGKTVWIVNWGMTQEVNGKTVWIVNWGMTQEVNGKTVWIVNWGAI